jgi:hypothetical protein
MNLLKIVYFTGKQQKSKVGALPHVKNCQKMQKKAGHQIWGQTPCRSALIDVTNVWIFRKNSESQTPGPDKRYQATICVYLTNAAALRPWLFSVILPA